MVQSTTKEWKSTPPVTGRSRLVEALLIVASVVAVLGLLTAIFGRLISRSAKDKEFTGTFDRKGRAVVEVELGEFSATLKAKPTLRSKGGQGSSLVEFEATAIVKGSPRQVVNAEDTVLTRQHQVRQLIDMAARKATDDELSDPMLTAVRKRLRKKLNKLFGEGFIHEIVFANFRRVRVPE